jgi:hypothetical protein
MPVKPTEREEEYIARQEFERLQKIAAEKQARLAVEEKQRLKDLHYMWCPKCGMQLVEIDYRGIKVDKCSACEGIWLDAGEIEAIAALDKTLKEALLRIFRK